MKPPLGQSGEWSDEAVERLARRQYERMGGDRWDEDPELRARWMERTREDLRFALGEED